jgi:hypothetical protein
MSPIASTRPRFATPDWGASAETPLCFFEAPLNLSYARFSRPITTTRTVPGDLWLHENKFDGSRAYWLHKTLAFGPEQDRLCRIDDPSVVVVMGVSGCGKRTIASMLAHRLRALRRPPRVTVSFEFGLMTRIRGWGSLMVSTLDELTARLGEFDLLCVSMMWPNEFIARAPRLAFIQSISAGTDQYARDALKDQRFAGGARPVLRCTRVAPPVGPVGIDVERPRGTLDDLFRDHHLLDAFEARQVEHGVEQEPFHDRA